jgi:hypothetical protein
VEPRPFSILLGGGAGNRPPQEGALLAGRAGDTEFLYKISIF